MTEVERLRRLARAALDEQRITVRRLRWMGRHSNHLFRAVTAGGERLVVRVCRPGGRTDAELAWLAALARDTGLTVPVARFSTLWGANTPSRRLTCDVLSQLALSCRIRVRYHRGPRASPKGTREDYHGSMNGHTRTTARCGPDGTGVTDRVHRPSGSRAPVSAQPLDH